MNVTYRKRDYPIDVIAYWLANYKSAIVTFISFAFLSLLMIVIDFSNKLIQQWLYGVITCEWIRSILSTTYLEQGGGFQQRKAAGDNDAGGGQVRFPTISICNRIDLLQF